MPDNTSCDTLPETSPIINRFRRGDVREDGKIFWSYKKGSPKGLWFLPDQFIRWQEGAKRRHQKRVKTPEQKARHREKIKLWHKQDPKRTAKQNARAKRKRAKDPVFALRHRFSRRLRKGFEIRTLNKSASSVSVIGLPWKDFASHIESRFLPGMNWDNRSKWHIDHIVPQAAAKTEQDVIDLNHYSNLRPLWKEDNLLKSDKLPSAEECPPNLIRFLAGNTTETQLIQV